MAVHLARTSGKVSGDARNLGIQVSFLRTWIKAEQNEGNVAFPGHGHQMLTAEQQDIRRLRKENEILRQEREILKSRGLSWPEQHLYGAWPLLCQRHHTLRSQFITAHRAGFRLDIMEPLVAQRLNLRLIRDHWDELRRLSTSIKAGSVTASLILTKLASYPRQNGLALRELGRMQRTLFTLEWLGDPELRRRVLAALNKGESLHSLKRAMAFHRNSEIRDRSFEAHSNRPAG